MKVFITGASSGIGSAFARHYAARGCALGLQGRRLAPGRDKVSLVSALARSRGKDSTANFLRKRAGIDGVKAELLREMLGDIDLTDPRRLAVHIKALLSNCLT